MKTIYVITNSCPSELFFNIYLSSYFLTISYTMISKYTCIFSSMMNDHASWQHFPDKLHFIDNNKL